MFDMLTFWVTHLIIELLGVKDWGHGPPLIIVTFLLYMSTYVIFLLLSPITKNL